MTDAFGGARVQVKAPERGIFPLDHDGECKAAKADFLVCLKKSNADYFPCRELSKAYLQCRMDKNLMAKEDPKELGFDRNVDYPRYDLAPTGEKDTNYVAGTSAKPGAWWYDVRANQAKKNDK